MFSDQPHRRRNALTGEWVLVSPHRTRRPWLGRQESQPPERRPSHDPKCLLCAGNDRINGARNPPYTGTYVFDNDFPALLHEKESAPNAGDLLVSESVSGACRVLCFSPRHDWTLPEMPVEAIREVVDAWAQQIRGTRRPLPLGAGLRKQRRNHGLLKSPSSRPDMGQRLHP